MQKYIFYAGVTKLGNNNDNNQSGVGQQSVTALRSITASSPTLLIRSSRARLWTSSAALRRSTNLLSSLRTASDASHPAASQPSRPAGCRLPADAGHRAAVWNNGCMGADNADAVVDIKGEEERTDARRQPGIAAIGGYLPIVVDET